MKIGFMGLGAIGTPMAARIADAGYRLSVWNRSPAKVAELTAQGAQQAATPAALADSCDVLCICVTGVEALEDVVFGAAGVARSRTPPAYVVDHSTVPTGDTRRLADRLKEATGSIWVDAPVSGGIVGAERGTLAAFVGGPEHAVDAVRPVLACFCDNITHMGPTGTGQATKACNQMIGFLSAFAVAEALVLGERLGVDVARLPDAFAGGFADTPAIREWRRNMAEGPLIGLPLHTEAMRAFLSNGPALPAYGGASPANLRKDIDIIRTLARQTGVTLPLIEQMAVMVGLLHANRGG